MDDLLASFPVEDKRIEAKMKKRQVPRLNKMKKIIRRILLDDEAPQKVELVSNKDKTDLSGYADILPEIRKISALLEDSLSEQRKQRRMLDVLRLQSAAPMYMEIREIVGKQQLTLRETLSRLANSEDSFARFGDGEFRLLGHPEENLSFQRNSAELRFELSETIKVAGTDGFLVGFPHIYIDANWSKIWSEIWYQISDQFDGNVIYGDSHVTRPVAFKQLREEATDLWRAVWEGKDVCIVTGKNSRFDLSPFLFDSVSSAVTVESTATDAFEDIPRVIDEVQKLSSKIVLIALGPAGTVLARKLHELGIRALDIGHLSDSHANVFLNAVRPEAKPIER